MRNRQCLLDAPMRKPECLLEALPNCQHHQMRNLTLTPSDWKSHWNNRMFIYYSYEYRLFIIMASPLQFAKEVQDWLIMLWATAVDSQLFWLSTALLVSKYFTQSNQLIIYLSKEIRLHPLVQNFCIVPKGIHPALVLGVALDMWFHCNHYRFFKPPSEQKCDSLVTKLVQASKLWLLRYSDPLASSLQQTSYMGGIKGNRFQHQLKIAEETHKVWFRAPDKSTGRYWECCLLKCLNWSRNSVVETSALWLIIFKFCKYGLAAKWIQFCNNGHQTDD